MALYRHRLDMKFRESREWFYVTLNSIGEGLVSADSDGNIIFMNRVAEELAGYSNSEAHNKPLAEVLKIRPKEKDASEKSLIEEILTSGRRATSRFGSCVLESWDGARIIVEVCAAPIRNVQDETVGVVLVFHDITDLKKTEEALKASHQALAAYSATLETKVKERTSELEQSRVDLKIYSESLEKTNEALKIIIEGIEEQKKEIETKITQKPQSHRKTYIGPVKIAAAS